MANKYSITPTSAEVAAAIKRKSAFNLPDRPSERGMKPDEIKRALYAPITDDENSALAELGRVIKELNTVLEKIEVAQDKYKISVLKTASGHCLTITDENGRVSYDIPNGKDGTDGIGLPDITAADEGKIVVVSEGGYKLGSANTIVEAAVTIALNTEVEG